ncbi:MAG: response regulator [Taibaiella sp.]|nr:response regulator [Taibaiella sp.]
MGQTERLRASEAGTLLAYVHHILLADDDADDCQLFNEALEEINIAYKLTTVRNGEQLMTLLNHQTPLPDILFLDLNMPRKNGFECLSEIKKSERLHKLPVIIISTSFEQKIVDQLYQRGAQDYLRKPNEFSKLKSLVAHAISMTALSRFTQPAI